jgi:hypothetical protein
MLAEGLSAIEISEKLRVSTRDIYLVKKDLPLFGGLIRDIEENIVNLRKKNCRKIK